MTQHNLYANMKKFIASQNGALKYTITVVISTSLSCNECLIDCYQITMIYIIRSIVIWMRKPNFSKILRLFIIWIGQSFLRLMCNLSIFILFGKQLFIYNVDVKRNDNIIAYFWLSFKEHLLIGIVPRGLNQWLYWRYVIQVALSYWILQRRSKCYYRRLTLYQQFILQDQVE